MSNKSKVLVAVFIVAGIAGLIIFDLALSSPPGGNGPAAAGPKPMPTSPPTPAATPPPPVEETLVASKPATLEDLLKDILEPPKPESTPAQTPVAEPPGQDRIEKGAAQVPEAPKKHIVAVGDRWWTIAESYYGKGKGHYYKQIQDANPELKDKFLTVGREIVIPPAPDAVRKGLRDEAEAKDSDIYTVQLNDTLEGISKKFYNTIGFALELFKLNQKTIRSPELLRAGQQILVPKRPPAAAPQAPPDAPAAVGRRVHEVKSGDTLWDIARKYAPGHAYAMMESIVKANRERLQSTTTPLRVGWKLVVPE